MAAAWNSAEHKRLREMWPSAPRAAVLAAFPGRNWGSIAAKAGKRGIRRPYIRRNRRVYPTDPLFTALRSARVRQRRTLKQIAKAVGVACAEVVHNWECGKRVPRAGLLLKWVDVLGLELKAQPKMLLVMSDDFRRLRA